MKPGPQRTAALVAWFQGLFEEPSEAPVLVGGGAVELYTGGAYVTGDLDFVGYMKESVGERLGEAGFRRKGRHWVHEKGNLFIEVPAREFDREVKVDSVRMGNHIVRTLSPEDVLVDRLASWKFWQVSRDGINAYLLWREHGGKMDLEWLDRSAKLEGVADALNAVKRFADGDREPIEVEQWAREGP